MEAPPTDDAESVPTLKKIASTLGEYGIASIICRQNNRRVERMTMSAVAFTPLHSVSGPRTRAPRALFLWHWWCMAYVRPYRETHHVQERRSLHLL